MEHPARSAPPTANAREKLLVSALSLIREKGYASTSVDDLCARAGVTKGAFFHHFKSKDALGVAAANHWSDSTGAFFASAPYHQHADPLLRVLGYLDFRRALLKGEISQFTCLVGTLVQEVYDTRPDVRDACEASISAHAARIEADIAQAMQRYGIHAAWTAESLALHTQAVLQGAFILAKAKGSAEIAIASVDHLRRYIEMLFLSADQDRNEGKCMSTKNTYLAVFMGDKTSPRSAAFWALPEAERKSVQQKGAAAWGAWVAKHEGAIVKLGGPLGKTKKVSERGIEDITNHLGAFTLVEAESHEAAAKMFEAHPHFTIFPGDRVEVMPVLPVPGT